MRRITVLIVTVLLLGSACGDDDGATPNAPALDAVESEAADALADTLGDLSDADLITYLTGESADLDCWAGRLVGSLGAEGVAGITAATSENEFTAALAALSSGDRDAAADGLAACVDRAALKTEIIEYLDPDVAECAISRMFDAGAFRRVFEGWVTGDEEAVGAIEADIGQSCGL